MIELIDIDELAKMTNFRKLELAMLTADGILPHIMREGIPRYDPIEAIKHLIKWAEKGNRTM
jgi:hypothetical protein